MLKQVLIAEDDEDMRRLLAFVLTLHGYDVTTVNDGVEALAAARVRPPDLVIADLMMPRMSGTELVGCLRTLPRLGSVPAVLLTAAPTRVPDRSDQLFNAVLEKPVELEALVRTLRAICPPGPERRQRDVPLIVDRRRSV